MSSEALRTTGDGTPSRQWHSHVFQVLSDAVLVLDPDGRVLDCNPAAELLYGQARAQMLGLTRDQITGTAGDETSSEFVPLGSPTDPDHPTSDRTHPTHHLTGDRTHPTHHLAADPEHLAADPSHWMPNQVRTAQIGASIGVTITAVPITAQALLQAADEAMYEAKHSGGNRHVTRYLPETTT